FRFRQPPFLRRLTALGVSCKLFELCGFPSRKLLLSTHVACNSFRLIACVDPRSVKEKAMGFATNAIHVGQEPDPATGAIVAPIYQTSTYVQEEFGKYRQGYDYARTNHPNRKALEKTLAKLEGGHAAYAFSSGMAAIDSVFRLLRPG